MWQRASDKCIRWGDEGIDGAYWLGVKHAAWEAVGCGSAEGQRGRRMPRQG